MPLILNGDGSINNITSINNNISSTELGYLDGVTSAIQSQFSGLPSYTQGSWTPNISGNNGTGSFTTRNGFYIKFGSLVYITFVCDFGSSNAGGSTQYLTGLPFAVSSNVPNTAIVGHMGSNGPADRDHQLMTLSVNRGILYLYNGGSQETTALSFASGFAIYEAA